MDCLPIMSKKSQVLQCYAVFLGSKPPRLSTHSKKLRCFSTASQNGSSCRIDKPTPLRSKKPHPEGRERFGDQNGLQKSQVDVKNTLIKKKTWAVDWLTLPLFQVRKYVFGMFLVCFASWFCETHRFSLQPFAAKLTQLGSSFALQQLHQGCLRHVPGQAALLQTEPCQSAHIAGQKNFLVPTFIFVWLNNMLQQIVSTKNLLQ